MMENFRRQPKKCARGYIVCKNLLEVEVGEENIAEALVSISRWPGVALCSVYPGSVVGSIFCLLGLN